EPTFTVVVIKAAGGRVIRNIKIETAILVVIQPNEAEAIVGFGVNAQLVAHIGKRAIAVIVIEVIARALQTPRAARNRDAAILAHWTAAERGQVAQVEGHVIG